MAAKNIVGANDKTGARLDQTILASDSKCGKWLGPRLVGAPEYARCGGEDFVRSGEIQNFNIGKDVNANGGSHDLLQEYLN